MKKVLLAAALFALALPAHAGTITITINTSVAPCNGSPSACTKTYTDIDANLAKIATAYAPMCMAGNLVGTPPVPTACTTAQTLTWWFNSLISGTVANVTNFFKAQQQAADPVIVPINPQ